mmetsp:Transcript_4511/g.4230  ORF Transcript_4511/g.4230 Transcript_4511/m.4230 type:complete len:104 (+) Transcript_4511:637-948(+)
MRHPHFNYRVNILQSIVPKLATNDLEIRNDCTATLFEILKNNDSSLLEFKLEVIKELSKVIKQRPHNKMDPKILDCLLHHEVIVDEEKAKLVNESSRKIEDLQ